MRTRHLMAGALACVAMLATGAWAQKEYLRTGEGLATNQYLQSANKAFYAIQQTDGNLCVYRGTPQARGPGGAVWCHMKHGAVGEFITSMQSDGNFCTYRTARGAVQGGATWCTMALSPGGQYFAIQQNDGNLCVYRGTGPGDNKGGAWCHGTNVLAASQVAPTPPPGGAPPPPTPTGTPAKDPSSPLAGLTSVSRGPALDQGQANAVLGWIGKKVSSDRQPYCYKQSYGRGVGTIPTTCPAGKQNQAGLCYNACNAGYGAAGPVCWQNCPSGYTDTGALCHYSAKSLTANLQRTGCHVDSPFGCIVPAMGCPSGYTNAGVFCALNTPSVPAGYSGLTGLDLTKKSYGRGAGTIPDQCPGGQLDAGLCYSNCKAGHSGVGPVCWQGCPGGKINCGAGCANSTTTCVTDTANMVVSPIMMVVNIATMGSTGAVSTGTMASVKAGLKAASLAGAAANASYQAGATTALWVNDYVGSFRQLTSTEIAAEVDRRFSPTAARWVKEQYALVHMNMMLGDDVAKTALNTLNAASGFDPSGVSGVVSAFAKPICATDEAFPQVSPRY